MPPNIVSNRRIKTANSVHTKPPRQKKVMMAAESSKKIEADYISELRKTAKE